MAIKIARQRNIVMKTFNSLLDLWQKIWFRPVPVSHLLILRLVMFGLPLYLLLSRYFDYVALVPENYFWQRIGSHWFSQLVWTLPSVNSIRFIHALAVLACIFGVVGLWVRQSALIASFGILFLDNIATTLTTSDAEVIPYAVAMWTLIVLDPQYHIPIWKLPKLTQERGRDRCPIFPFTLIQSLFVTIYFINGFIKLVNWEEWALQPAIFYYVRNWNSMTPLIASFWPTIRSWNTPAILWQILGVVTIFFELTIPITLVIPRLILIWWLVLVGMHLTIWATMTTSFLIFPWLFLISFLPYLWKAT